MSANPDAAPKSATRLAAHPVDTASHAADRALIDAVLSGEAAALERFVARMQFVPRVLSILNARSGRRLREEDLSDLTQEALATIWGKLATFEGRATLETWVQRFCVHVFLNHGRRLARQRERSVVDERLLEREAVPEGPPLPEHFERLAHELARLGPPARDVLRMKHEEDLTFEQIAARLQTSANTAKSWYYRGLAVLRERLGAEDA